MSVTILTTTYKRPFLLKRLGETIVPLINKLKGKLDWKIIIDDLDDSYDIVLQELKQKVDNKSLVNSIKQKNVGKFKSIINFLNHFITITG